MYANFKLTGKDWIAIGIFSALYFVISFIGMFLGIIPIMWILMPGVVAILAGIPFLFLCSKVQKPGAVLLMGLVTALLYYVTGQFTLLILWKSMSGLHWDCAPFKNRVFKCRFICLTLCTSPFASEKLLVKRIYASKDCVFLMGRKRFLGNSIFRRTLVILWALSGKTERGRVHSATASAGF